MSYSNLIFVWNKILDKFQNLEEKVKKFKYNEEYEEEVKLESNQDDDDQTQIIFDPKASMNRKSNLEVRQELLQILFPLSFQQIEEDDLVRSMNRFHVHEGTQRDKLE